MKFLLDTNIVIRAEPTAPDEVEAGTEIATELIGLLAEARYEAFVHPVTLFELSGDRVHARRQTRERLLKKYRQLPAPPRIPAEIERELGRPAKSSRDHRDHTLLAAVHAESVDYLVTDDQRLIRKSRRVGLGSRVVAPSRAAATLRGLLRTDTTPPPAVRRVLAHELVGFDPIFESVRADYAPEFDNWLIKCKREHRAGWIIAREEGALDAVCIVKEESGGEHGLRGRLLKLCTFKVSDRARGFRFGELLLKPVFDYSFDSHFDYIYVEVFPKYSELVDLLTAFGFDQLPGLTDKGEAVLVKTLKYSSQEFDDLDALSFHVRFGPRYLKVKDAFVVPIRPEFHDMLFPECAEQPGLFEGARAFGNSILKAYLSNAATRQITPGSAVLFYESGGEARVRCVGVVEDTLASESPTELARFVGQRTVYTFKEIENKCGQDVLAILFRQASGVYGAPMRLADLRRNGVLKAPPRSITRVNEEGLQWIRDQLELSP